MANPVPYGGASVPGYGLNPNPYQQGQTQGGLDFSQASALSGQGAQQQSALLGQSGNQQLAETALQGQNAQNVANTQAGASMYGSGVGALSSMADQLFGGANAVNLANTQGPWSIYNTIAGNETSPQMQANLYREGITNQVLPQIAPFMGQIMNQLPGLLGSIGGGGFGGGGLPAGTSGPPMSNIPLSVMNPYQAQGLIDQTAGGTAASTQNQLNAVTPQSGSNALAQQLQGQGVGANRAGLTDATTSFLSALAPMNAQQALSGAQTAEGQRANYLGNVLAREQVGNQFTGALSNFLNSIIGKTTGGIL